MLERQAAARRGLADQKGRPCVVVVRGDIGKRRQCRGIHCLVGKIGGHSGDEVAFVDGVEDFEGAGDFEPAVFRRRFRPLPQRDAVEPQSRPR